MRNLTHARAPLLSASYCLSFLRCSKTLFCKTCTKLHLRSISFSNRSSLSLAPCQSSFSLPVVHLSQCLPWPISCTDKGLICHDLRDCTSLHCHGSSFMFATLLFEPPPRDSPTLIFFGSFPDALFRLRKSLFRHAELRRTRPARASQTPGDVDGIAVKGWIRERKAYKRASVRRVKAVGGNTLDLIHLPTRHACFYTTRRDACRPFPTRVVANSRVRLSDLQSSWWW